MNSYIDGYLTYFLNAMKDIESLREFYKHSSQIVKTNKMKAEKDFQKGKIISDLISSIWEYQGMEERNKRIDVINDMEVFDGIKFKDICCVDKFVSEGAKTISYSMTEKYKDDKFNPFVAKKEYEKIQKYENILIESVLSHIVVIYEAYLEKNYKILLWENPLRHFEGQTILLADVFKDDFLEKIQEKFNTEVEAKMYDSIKTTYLICEKENINLEKYEKILTQFNEVLLRRNAYIHTDGRANKRYLKTAHEQYVKNIKENEILICDDIYIENAFVVLTKLIFTFTFEILCKRSISKEALEHISTHFFERLKDGEYVITKYVYYLLSQYKQLEFIDRTLFRINYIISLKQLGEEKTVDKELKSLDVSIATNNFKIAKECLANNHEKVFELLQKTYPDSFNATHIREWPLFIDFRNTEYYEKFVAAHPEDFNVQEIEQDSDLEFEEKEIQGVKDTDII